MEAFIQDIFTFPTIFYGGLLILVILYWLSAVVGVIDIEALEGDLDIDTDSEASGLAGWLTKFKLDGIPLTMTASLVILVSWVLCFLAVHFIYPLLPGGWVQIAMGFWILLITPVIAAMLISPLLQPLKPLFQTLPEKSAADLVGQYAVVRSGKVTATMGEADFQDGGAGLILKIRSEEPNQIKRGNRVKLKKYDQNNNTYQV